MVFCVITSIYSAILTSDNVVIDEKFQGTHVVAPKLRAKQTVKSIYCTCITCTLLNEPLREYLMSIERNNLIK